MLSVPFLEKRMSMTEVFNLFDRRKLRFEQLLLGSRLLGYWLLIQGRKNLSGVEIEFVCLFVCGYLSSARPFPILLFQLVKMTIFG